MDILTKINWIDILVVIILFRVTYVAFQSGLSHEIFPLIGSIGTLVISLHYYHNIAVFVNQSAIKLPVKLLDVVSFILLIVVTAFIFKLLSALVDKIIKVTWHPVVEKFGGLIAGLIRAAVIVSIVLTILAIIPLPYLQRSIREKSLTGMYFLRVGPTLYGRVSGILPTFKIEASSVDREDIVQNLAADKRLGPELDKEKSR